MATAAQRRTLRQAEAALIRGMTTEQLRTLAGDPPDLSARLDRLTSMIDTELTACVDGDEAAAAKITRLIHQEHDA